MYRLIASDLDGTLLSSSQSVSHENLNAIELINSMGIEFVPATGRALSEIPMELINSSAIRYLITSNGSAIYDKVCGKMIISSYISCDALKLMLDILRGRDALVLAHEGGVNYCDSLQYNEETFDRCGVNQYYRELISRKAVQKSNFTDYMIKSESVEMLCIIFKEKEMLSYCQDTFTEMGLYCTVQRGAIILEVYSRLAGKGAALQRLTEKLGIDFSNVIAVGDNDNDSSLIEFAGLGLAVKNACDELKGIADKVICSNDEHCAKFILENIL